MKVFVTGASGFIGSAVVKELLAAGHTVVGLARSAESAKAITDAGAEALQGSLDDLDILRLAATQADGVIHTAFIHDFANYMKAAAADRAAIETMGGALAGTDKPIVVTGGVLGVGTTNGFVTEADEPMAGSPRGSESAAMALAAVGIRASVVRLPPCVHGFDGTVFKAGFGSIAIQVAKQTGVSAYIGEGRNRWSAVHREDAARLFRLAMENAAHGGRYNGIGDEAITLKAIATAIGQKLKVPVKSISAEEAMVHFGVMGRFFVLDGAATSYLTREQLGWKPTQAGLLEDMAQFEL